MLREKHIETLKEAEEEIDSALTDKRGLLPHQRRLAFSLSIGMVSLIELYFHNLSVIKEGSKINHLWFKRKVENIKERLQNQISSPIDNIENINEIVDLARKLEEKRDDLVYGAPSNEKILQEKINLFLELRKIIKC